MPKAIYSFQPYDLTAGEALKALTKAETLDAGEEEPEEGEADPDVRTYIPSCVPLCALCYALHEFSHVCVREEEVCCCD